MHRELQELERAGVPLHISCSVIGHDSRSPLALVNVRKVAHLKGRMWNEFILELSIIPWSTIIVYYLIEREVYDMFEICYIIDREKAIIIDNMPV